MNRNNRPAMHRRAALSVAAVALLAPAVQVVSTPGSAEEVDCSTVAWMDTSKTPAQRARALLDASSLDQKLRWLNEHSANNPTQTAFPNGVTMPAQVPCTPVIQYTDGPANVSGAGTGITVFPAPIALSATWDEELAREKGKAQGYEAFRKHRNVLLAPGLASGRDPRSGRTAEYLGEDALLSGLMAAAGINGLRDNPNEPVESVIKHYVANEQELDRRSSSSNIDQRSLRELYTLPFEIAIRRGNPGGIMCAYNDVNNIPACGNPNILNTILRDEIGYEGWVVTDFGARHSLTAATPSLVAGLDQELNRWRFWNPDAIKAAIEAGTVTVADIDRAAFRVVHAHIKARLFDVPLPAAPDAVVTSPAHKAISQEIVEKGSVLLKNHGILPLSARGKRIAVIGQTASNVPTDGVSAATVCSYTGPSSVACTPEAPLDSITAWASANGGSVSYDNGADTAAAAATAAAADVAVVFGHYLEGEFNDRPNLNLDGNGDALIDAVATANRNTVVVLQTGGPVVMPWLNKVKAVLEVWYAGERMGPAITNLISGAANPSGKLTHSFPASLADVPTAGSPAQYPGIFASTGTTTPPSPRNDEIRQVNYTEGLKIGYRWYESEGITPLFPFGHGLSYNRYDYGHLRVSESRSHHWGHGHGHGHGHGKWWKRHGRDSRHDAKAISIEFKVRNSGRRFGTEVAQAYVELPSWTGEPSKRLVGWERVSLAPGQTKRVEITLSASDIEDLHLLEFWNPHTEEWTTAQGRYKFSVGSSFDTSLTDSIRIH